MARYDLNQIPNDYIVEVTNRLKGLYLIESLRNLWMEVYNTVCEAVTKTIPKKRKCKKAQWLSEEALQIAEKRRDEKVKIERKRYIHLNEDFQRIARRGKKAFLSEQCKDMEENDRMGKTRYPFKKTRDTKRTFHTTMGTIKDRNVMNLIEAEDIKEVARIHRRTVQKRSS